jgi:uncharacterized protein YjbI with pentapeptide repeats
VIDAAREGHFFRGIAMSEANPSPARVDWRCADLRGCNMAGMSLRHADMRASDLRGCNFTGSDLSHADFRGSRLDGAIFQNATLYGAKMQGVEAFQADFRNADLRQANLGGAYLEGAMMTHQTPRQPTPSEIARDTQPSGPEPEHSRANGRGM